MRDKLRQINSTLDSAYQVMGRMGRRIISNKFIILLIVIVLLLVIGGIVYFRFFFGR